MATFEELEEYIYPSKAHFNTEEEVQMLMDLSKIPERWRAVEYLNDARGDFNKAVQKSFGNFHHAEQPIPKAKSIQQSIKYSDADISNIPEDKYPKSDINLVMTQAMTSFNAALFALDKNNGDLVNAIMDLTTEAAYA